MISAKELLEKGNCVNISCWDCPIKGIGCDDAPVYAPFNEKAIQRLKELVRKESSRTATLHERMAAYEKAHRALWQSCKDDLNAIMDNSED